MTTSTEYATSELPIARDGGACVIRPGVAADAAALAAFAAHTFVDTYGKDNTAENLRLHLESSYAPALQSRELHDPDVATLLALDGAEIAGYAQVRRGPAVDCVRGDAPVELHRFYVARRWHGGGIARPLLARACDAARRFGGTSVWLKVWERNPRAIAFYSRCGFTDVGAACFIVGTDPQTDRVLQLDLRAPA